MATETPRPTSPATLVPTSAATPSPATATTNLTATPNPTTTPVPTIAPTPTAEPATRIDATKALECLKEFQDLMFNHEPDELRPRLDAEDVQIISDGMAASRDACQQAGWDPVFATETAEPCQKGDIIGSYGEKLRVLRPWAWTQDGKRGHTNPTVVLINRDETTGGPSIGFLIHFEKLPFSNDSGCWYNDFGDTYFYIRTSGGNVLYEFRDFEFADTPQIREALGLETS